MLTMLRTKLKTVLKQKKNQFNSIFQAKFTQFSDLVHISSYEKLEIISGNNPEYLRNSFILQYQTFWKIPEQSAKVSFQNTVCVEIKQQISFSSLILHKLLGTYMSHFSYACKMQCLLNLVLESWEYLWFYLTFWIAILDCGLKLHKLLIHTLVMLQK